ncbi:MAG: sulfatase, partial [Rhodothermales bacterium]|nr:sulfatase [Rhodothermales bacterium]
MLYPIHIRLHSSVLIAAVFAVLVCAGQLSGCAQATDEVERPPNVLFISIDDLNDWVGALDGHPNARTPNIDRLASLGTVFLNAHTQAPICGPSRASLMTGLRPSTTGIYGQIEDKDLRGAHPLLQSAVFLPEYFGQNGYKTMGIGKLFHRHAPEGVFEESGGRVPGFGPKPPERRYWDQPETSTDWGPFPELDEDMPDYQSAEWAINRIKQDHDRPFFLAVGFLRPHVPWHVPESWFAMHPVGGITVPPLLSDDMEDVPAIGHQVADVWQMPTTAWAIDNNYWPAIVQSYLASVSFVDAQVGRILDALETSTHSENTVVVLFSDHGYHIGEKNRFAKSSLWERSTRVPLVFTGPGVAGRQSVSSAVELLDIYPTLLELAGLPANGEIEGRSLVPLLRESKSEWPHAAITTYGQNNHAVRTDRFRYIRYEDGSEEFYDHITDPNEWHNLAQDSTHRDSISRLTRHLPTRNSVWSSVSQ